MTVFLSSLLLQYAAPIGFPRQLLLHPARLPSQLCKAGGILCIYCSAEGGGGGNAHASAGGRPPAPAPPRRSGTPPADVFPPELRGQFRPGPAAVGNWLRGLEAPFGPNLGGGTCFQGTNSELGGEGGLDFFLKRSHAGNLIPGGLGHSGVK